jgi:feruloyl-CoA synthase
MAGVTLKLVQAQGDVYEIRVRGASVTPGYYRRPDLNEIAFDSEGFYQPGDGVSLANQGDLDAGLLFRGRLAEDFKLSTGTFVHVGAVRAALLSAAPILSDAVLAGEGRDFVCALAWLNPAELRRTRIDQPEPKGGVMHSHTLANLIAPVLLTLNANAGSSAGVQRLLLLADPPSLESGEMTDKGYVNQRAVLANRAELVEMVFAEPATAPVITAEAKVVTHASVPT